MGFLYFVELTLIKLQRCVPSVLVGILGCGGVGERGGQNMWNSPAEKTCEKKLALK